MLSLQADDMRDSGHYFPIALQRHYIRAPVIDEFTDDDIKMNKNINLNNNLPQEYNLLIEKNKAKENKENSINFPSIKMLLSDGITENIYDVIKNNRKNAKFIKSKKNSAENEILQKNKKYNIDKNNSLIISINAEKENLKKTDEKFTQAEQQKPYLSQK